MVINNINEISLAVTWLALVLCGAFTLIALAMWTAFHSIITIIEYYLMSKGAISLFKAFTKEHLKKETK